MTQLTVTLDDGTDFVWTLIDGRLHRFVFPNQWIDCELDDPLEPIEPDETSHLIVLAHIGTLLATYDQPLDA